MPTISDLTVRQEFSARWQNLRAKFSDVGPRPSDDELVVVLKKACKVESGLAELQNEIWTFLVERGCFTTRILEDVRDNVPLFADRAEKLLQELRGQPVQIRLPIGDEGGSSQSRFLDRV